MLISGDTQWIVSVGLICAAVTLFAWGVYRHKRDFRDRELHALRSSHSKFRSLFENVTQGVYQSTAGGKLLTANPALVRMFGYDSEDQFLKTSVRDLYTDSEDRDRHLRYLDTNGQLHNAEIRLRHKDGTALVVIENSRAVRDENGQLLYYEGTLTDITQHKRAQRREQDRNSVLELIARNEKLEIILGAVGGMVEHQFPNLMAAVDLIEEGRLFSASAPSLPPAFTSAIDGVPTGQGAGPAGQAALLGRPVISANIFTDQIWGPYREIALKHEIRAGWSVPIMLSSGPVVGTLTLFSGTVGEPDRETLELMQQASQLAAIAIERRQLNQQLTFQAQHDAVTKLPNRFLFGERLEQSLALARRNQTRIALLYVDLDDFKLINDSMGHTAGDNLLREVAERFLKCVCSTDTVARTGGDEFTVILSELETLESAQGVAQKLLRSLQTSFEINGRTFQISASIGISLFPDDGEEAEVLQHCADLAMYRAKNKGKNGFERLPPDRREARAHPEAPPAAGSTGRGGRKG